MPESECHRGAGHRWIERATRKDSAEARFLGHRYRYRPSTADNQERVPATRRPDVHLFHELKSGHNIRVVRFSEVRLETRQSKLQLYSPAFSRSGRTQYRSLALREACHDDR